MNKTATVLLLLASLISYGQDSVFEIRKKPIIKVPKGQEYVFGYLMVPENRSSANSRTIQLPVYIFKARSENPAPDPIIYLVGGPGSSVMGAVPYIKYYAYANDRDFILMEQRGTRYAKPHLACPEWSKAVHESNSSQISDEKAMDMFQVAAKNCRERLIREGVDLNGYRTTEIAADVEDLRKALGIDRYNLLTLSYGTKIAQTLMRDYPDPIRSVVMDSPLPLESNYDLESIDNLFSTYDRLFEDCENDPDCNFVFPDLKDRFLSFLQETTENPIQLTATNPKTDSVETFMIGGKDLFYFFTYIATYRVPEAPGMINRLVSGDYSMIREVIESGMNSQGDGAGIGMRISVWCSEETSFVSSQELDEVKGKYPSISGASPVVFEPEICNIWKVTAAGDIENQPVKSDIPVLIINGAYDNETPVKWGAKMKSNLSNSYHITFEMQKHTPTTYWDNPCGMRVATIFFNDPSKMPESDCLLKKPPVFKTDD